MNNELDVALSSEFDRMRGRILGMIEAVGFPAERERAIKQLFKSLSYDAEARIGDLLLEKELLPRGN